MEPDVGLRAEFDLLVVEADCLFSPLPNTGKFSVRDFRLYRMLRNLLLAGLADADQWIKKRGFEP